MEDEEGYTALRFQGRRKPKDKGEAMLQAEPRGPPWHRRMLWISGLLNLLLAMAATGFGVWIFKLHQEQQKPNEKCRSECDFNISSAGSGPLLCPLNWQLHGRSCYYFSKELKNWTRSQEDCSSRGSHLVVIENQAELSFIGSTIRATIKNYAWIGLFNTVPGWHWTWVNGSSLNEKQFRVLGAAEGNSCGLMKLDQIESESCVNDLNWICEKVAGGV